MEGGGIEPHTCHVAQGVTSYCDQIVTVFLRGDNGAIQSRACTGFCVSSWFYFFYIPPSDMMANLRTWLLAAITGAEVPENQQLKTPGHGRLGRDGSRISRLARLLNLGTLPAGSVDASESIPTFRGPLDR